MVTGALKGKQASGALTDVVVWGVHSLVRAASVAAPRFVERKAAELMARPRAKGRGRASAAAGEPTRISFREGFIAGWQAGPSSGPLALLVHGWEGSSRQYAALSKRLVAYGFRVVAFDMPAHGASSGERCTVLDMRDAILRVASHHGAPKIIVAHSLGATASVLALKQGLRTDRLALVAPAREPGLFVQRIVEGLGLTPEQHRRVDGLVAAELGEFESLDCVRIAKTRKEPLLVAHSKNDRTIPYELGRNIADAWPDAKLLSPPSLGHRRILEDDGVLTQIVGFAQQAGSDLGQAVP